MVIRHMTSEFLPSRALIVVLSQEVGSIRPHIRVKDVMGYQSNAQSTRIVSKSKTFTKRPVQEIDANSRRSMDNHTTRPGDIGNQAKVEDIVVEAEAKEMMKYALVGAFENRRSHKASQLARDAEY